MGVKLPQLRPDTKFLGNRAESAIEPARCGPAARQGFAAKSRSNARACRSGRQAATANQTPPFNNVSTSGKSPNLLAALRTARTRGLRTIAVLGKGGGPAKALADHPLVVPSDTTARIQEVHTFILHAWLTLME